MTTSNIEVSAGQKIGTVLVIIFFAAIGGFFGFLFNLFLELGEAPSPTTRLVCILVGAVLFSLIPIISLGRGVKKGREKIEAAGGDSSSVNVFSLGIIGCSGEGNESGNGTFSGGEGGGWGGGDSGGDGGGGGGGE